MPEYTPTPILTEFHHSDAFYRGVMGPVGSGKSTAMCCEIGKRAKEQAPDSRGVRATRWAVVRNTYRELQDTTVKTWLQWFNEDIFGAFNNGNMEHRLKFGLPDGTRVDCLVLFRALDRPSDVKKLLSLELTGAWFNEAREMPKSIVDAMSDRVERYPAKMDGGCTWAGVFMDTNPPDTDHWWYKLAEEDRPEGWDFFHQPGGLFEVVGDNGPEFIPNPNAENQENLPEGYYVKRMPGKSLGHIRVYYCSKYGYVQDGKPVFPEFHTHMHVAKQNLEPVPGRPIYVGIDFGLTPAAVFGQKLVSGRWQWLDELVTEDMGTTRFAEHLKAKCADDFYGFEFRAYGDPAGDQRSQVDERTPFDILKVAGIEARQAPTNDPLIRQESIRAPLTRMVDGGAGLVVSPRCTVLIKGMSGAYCYKRVQIVGDERYRDEPDKNKFSHVCDAAQYMMIGAGEGDAVVSSSRQVDVSRLQREGIG